jgi:PIN domain nuclease of toxin-antitoxin system
MPVYIADSSALLAYLRNESGGNEVAKILGDTSNRVFVHALNACEVYYDLLRRGGSALAARAITGLRSDGIEVRRDMDDAFWMDVGTLKVHPGGLSLADCVGIALARVESCEFLTADHHEMDKLVGTGIVSLKFIR